jgi:hypothetical protein
MACFELSLIVAQRWKRETTQAGCDVVVLLLGGHRVGKEVEHRCTAQTVKVKHAGLDVYKTEKST